MRKPVSILLAGLLISAVGVCQAQLLASSKQPKKDLAHSPSMAATKSLKSVLAELQTKGKASFFYKSQVVEQISVDVSAAERLEEGNFEKNLQNFLETYQLKVQKSGKNLFVISDKTEARSPFQESIAAAKISGETTQDRTVRGTVTAGDTKEGLPGVSVIVKGTSRGTTTDASGKYNLSVGTGSKLVFSFVGYESTEVSLGNSDVVDVSLKASSLTLGEVMVVGSRSTQVRTSIETVAPVDVITSKELISTGQIEPTQMMSFVAPSFVSNRQTVSDGTDHIDPASLRGLGPDQVLVLVNGKRRYQTALININGTVGKGSVGTDLNSIPAAAIERIEVLRDGAASQYGSDAIAGVINVVLKKSIGTQVNTHYGQQFAGDGRNLQVGISHGIKIKQKGYLNFSLDIRKRDSTNRAGNFLGTVFTPAGANPTAAQRAADDAAIAANGGFNRANNMQVGNSNLINIGGVINFDLPLSSKVDLYATLMIGYRNGKGAGFYRYPKQGLQNPIQVDLALFPRGFLPQIESTIMDQSLIAGLTGKTTSGWRWDLSNTYGGNSFKFNVANSNNASLEGTSRQTTFDAGRLQFFQNTTNLDVSRDFGQKLNLQSFNVAFGAEARIDMFKITAGEDASWRNFRPEGKLVGTTRLNYAPGAQVFPGYRPENAVDVSRTVMAAYADIETDLTKRFLVNAAARFENYSDFGSAFAGKLAVRLKLADALSIRGSVSNGFRAPSIHQSYFNNTSTQFQIINGQTVPSNTLTVRNDSPVANALGFDALKPEKSTNLSLGITSRVANTINITIDAYQIDIKDRVILAGPFRRTNAVVGNILTAANVPTDIQVVQAFGNIIDTRTRGLDIIVTASPRLGKGTLDFMFAANFNKTDFLKVNGTSKIPATLDASNNYFFFDRAEQSRILVGNPRDKFTASLGYRVGKFSANVRATRFGEVESWSPATTATTNLDEIFSAKTLTDLSVGYQITKALKAVVGANNLFDVYPDKQRWFNEGNGNLGSGLYGNTGEGRFVYSRNATQFGFNGGYYFVSLSASF